MPDPASFEPVAQADEIPEGGKKLVRVGGKAVLLIRSEGELFAVDSLCTHDHEQLVGGTVRKCTIVCPYHGARFSLRNGRPFGPPAFEPLSTYAVMVQDETVLVSAEPT